MEKSRRYAALIITVSILLCVIMPVNVLGAEKKKDNNKDKVTTVTISAAGDCTLGVDSRYNNRFNEYYSRNNSKYFFKNVKSVFEKDDITIVNFEGTLTTSSNRAQKKFTFKGPAKYTKILTEGSVEVVNLANNHTMDFGEQGFKDTKAALKKAKIAYSYGSEIAYKSVNGVKIAFIGFNELADISKKDIKKAIDTAKKADAQIIVTSFHWGIEREYYANATQKSLGHYAIDQGATLVIGHHPHVLQGIEKYNGRYILYSMGNFCFGGNSNPSDKDTMIFQQTFYIKNGELTDQNDAKVLPCSLSGSSNTNTFQPKLLKGDERIRVIKKINKYSKGMNTRINSKGKLN